MATKANLTGLALREAVAVRVMGTPDGSVFAPNDPQSRADFWKGAQQSIANGPAYEADERAAHAVIERMIGLGCKPLIRHSSELYWNVAFVVPHDPTTWNFQWASPSGSARGPFCEAVCRAAVRAAELMAHSTMNQVS